MVAVCRVVLNFVSGVTFISSFHRHAISNSISIMHIELKQRLGWQLDNILHFFESISFEAHNEVKLFLLQNLAIIKNKGTPNLLVFVTLEFLKIFIPGYRAFPRNIVVTKCCWYVLTRISIIWLITVKRSRIF